MGSVCSTKRAPLIFEKRLFMLKGGVEMNEEHQEEHHEMQLVQHFENGGDEWACPECGRRFIIQMQPEFQKEILENGDETAVHSGGIGGLSLSVSQPSQVEGDLDEATLEPWKRWMESVDFEHLWNKDPQ
jgi:hypothetical protein